MNFNANICAYLRGREIHGKTVPFRRVGVGPRFRPRPLELEQEVEEDPESESEPDRKRRRVEESAAGVKPAEKLLNVRVPIDRIIPRHALQNGHIVMGFTQCGTYILSYTIRLVEQNGGPNQYQVGMGQNRLVLEFDRDILYTYKLYYWKFRGVGQLAKKYGSCLLFDRNGVIDSNMMLQMCQWKYEGFQNDRFIVVVARSSAPEENPRCYLTLAQLPPKVPCKKCTYRGELFQEYFKVLSPCPTHSLTVSLSYEMVSPYPNFDPDVSLCVTEDNVPTVIINTGNLIHQMQFNPEHTKHVKSNVLKADINQNNSELAYFYKSLVPNSDSSQRRFFKRSKQTATTPPSSLPKNHQQCHTMKGSPDDVYETFTEEEDLKVKNYRLFRTRLLADKKYEFVDDYVLRPLNNSNKRSHSRRLLKKQPSSKTVYVNKCTAKVTRSYVLMNEESVSTTTEIEDNESNFMDYPVALPTYVYTDQAQLSMIPNYKAVDKKVAVVQTSIDIEVLSNEIANLICNKEGLRMTFLIDFDAVILQTHPNDCTVTALLVLLIQASGIKDDARRNYEGNYLLQWNPANQSCHILFKGPLKPSCSSTIDRAVWNPTTNLPIQAKRLYTQGNLHLSNRQMAYEFQSLEEITDPTGIITLFQEVTQPSQSFEDEYDDDNASLFSA